MTTADFDLPGPVVLEPGDVARLIGRTPSRATGLALILEAVQIGAITFAAGALLVAELDAAPAPPGLVPCPTCGTDQALRDGRMAVHFATREATRPCVASWPVKGRAA